MNRSGFISRGVFFLTLFVSPPWDFTIGGIKLGAGGLIRAYGGAARLVLREAPVIVTVPKASFQLRVDDSSYVGAVYEALSKGKATPSGEDYGADGSFSITVTCELSSLDVLKQTLKDATKGTVEFDDT